MILIKSFQLADEMMNGAKSELARFNQNRPIDIEAYKETKEVARDNSSGIMYETCHLNLFRIFKILFIFCIELAMRQRQTARWAHQLLVRATKEDLILAKKSHKNY